MIARRTATKAAAGPDPADRAGVLATELEVGAAVERVQDRSRHSHAGDGGSQCSQRLDRCTRSLRGRYCCIRHRLARTGRRQNTRIRCRIRFCHPFSNSSGRQGQVSRPGRGTFVGCDKGRARGRNWRDSFGIICNGLRATKGVEAQRPFLAVLFKESLETTGEVVRGLNRGRAGTRAGWRKPVSGLHMSFPLAAFHRSDC